MHVQQHTIDGVHIPSTGLVGPVGRKRRCQSPSDPKRLNRLEMVVSMWRAVDCLPSSRYLRDARGAGGRDQMSSAERPRRKTWHDLKRAKSRGRTAIRNSLSFSAVLSNGTQANELLASLLHGVRWCVCGWLLKQSRQGWPAAGICRSERGLQHHRLTL